MTMKLDRAEEIRRRAMQDLRQSDVLMDGHFDFGNGYHGRLYVNPHRLFQQPSMIWRLAQDLLELVPHEIKAATEIVAGPATGGALLAHTLAGLLDGQRSLSHPPCGFAPFSQDAAGSLMLRPFYARALEGRRVVLADDVRNTGTTFERCAALVRDVGGTVIATLQICDRMASIVNLGVPNVSLVEYGAPENYHAAQCPLCQLGIPLTTF
jgi:orotate phosphoribosyltransferase